MDFDAANKERDRRLRFSMLRMIGMALPGKLRMTGGILRDQINGTRAEAEGFEDDDHVLRLVRDLEVGGYIKSDDLRTRKSQKYEPSIVACDLLDKGRRFLAEDPAVPADVMIDDGRIVKDQ